MRISGLRLYAISSCAALAMLGACGPLPLSQPARSVVEGKGRASSALVGKDQSLLYISDFQAGEVYMVALPSGRLVGKLTGLEDATGVCVDQHGNVFADNQAENQVRAYAHGVKSAFRVLNDQSWEPYGCSVDPKTGNLAVCNFRTNQSEGSIALYFKAKGSAHYYEYSSVYNFWYCAYDGDGNLYADAFTYGKSGSKNPIFLELTKASKNLRPVSLTPAITGGGVPALFWDGKHLAIAGTNSGVIDQYKISGSTGTRVGVVKLDGASEVSGPFWITPNGKAQTLYAPIVEDNIGSVGVYRYPAGGKRRQNLYDAPLPFAAAVSMPN
ncbi:MAG TPA: hypothetical protein VKR56_07765 [Candidatus Cybelea sp.]|nr:hypothetical protein [Candidatus Cybelea sp.]